MKAKLRVADGTAANEERKWWPVLSAALIAIAASAASQAAYGQGDGRSGQEIVDTVCAACHKTGAQGAADTARSTDKSPELPA